jgi:hypothetical protein
MPPLHGRGRPVFFSSTLLMCNWWCALCAQVPAVLYCDPEWPGEEDSIGPSRRRRSIITSQLLPPPFIDYIKREQTRWPEKQKITTRESVLMRKKNPIFIIFSFWFVSLLNAVHHNPNFPHEKSIPRYHTHTATFRLVYMTSDCVIVVFSSFVFPNQQNAPL